MPKVLIEIESLPSTCKECKFLRASRYQCHNESGMVYGCMLGYMSHADTRDFPVDYKVWPKCRLKEDWFDY